MGEYIGFSEGLLVTMISMVTVFVVLILISFLINGLKVFGVEKDKEKAIKQTQIKKELPEDDEISEELVAVISAAIACSLGQNLPEVDIKSIKRYSGNADQWSMMSKTEHVKSEIY